jgi:hypothetical protein
MQFQILRFKKIEVVRNKSNLLLKIILYSTWTLQLFIINLTNEMVMIYNKWLEVASLIKCGLEEKLISLR